LITVGLAIRVEDPLVERIRALDERLNVVHVVRAGSRTPLEGSQRARLFAELAPIEIMLGHNRILPDYFDAMPELQWFQAINAGVDHMAAQGLLRRPFTVTTAAGLAAAPIAEWVMGAIIVLAKGMQLSVRHQLEHKWDRRGVLELSGKTLGIIGLGEIGRETARRGRAFGMTIVASRRTAPPGATDPDCDLLVSHDNLDELLARSDYVALAVPLTAETRHMLGAREFSTMKPTAFVINIARGEVIDQAAMIEALRAGTIAGAGLDVFDPEPLPPENPRWDMSNVLMTPHISGSVEGYTEKAVELFIGNLRRYLAGEPLAHVASGDRGY
jgi:phosphoglycerate dehydrogenase-like enzyme